MPDRVELLAPAGSMEALRAAVAAGADAVYMGTASFGARADVGFSYEDTRRAVAFAHLYGRRVHVTVNTLCKQQELNAVRETLKILQDIGADAVLIQDAGILRIALEEFPGLTIHASTQMTIHQPSGVRWLKEIGVSRAVLARECSLETIRACSEAGLETEVFIHGALCVSVSGQCGLSSWIGPRSGNRGKCAQPCRMTYEYRGQSGCWLSPADLCARSALPDLLNAGVSSLKIEGRLKRPEYVYVVTSLYRQALDQIREGTFNPDDPEAAEALTQIFSRGQFTKGYASGREDREVIYPAYAANRGVLLGKTVSSGKTRGGAALTDVRLTRPLNDGDGLTADGQSVIYSGPDIPAGTATLRLHRPVPQGTEVWRTESEAQLSRARSRYEEKAFRETHPLSVSAELTAFPGQETVLRLAHDPAEVQVSGAPAEKEQSVPLTEESALRSLSKMGGTPFSLDHFVFRSADAYLPVSALNDLRKKGLESLAAAIIESRRPRPRSSRLVPGAAPCRASAPEARALYVHTSDYSEIPLLLKAGADQVLFEPPVWTKEALAPCFGKQDVPPWILQLPTVCGDGTLSLVRELCRISPVPVSVGSIGQLGVRLPNAIMAGTGVPVMNGEAERFLADQDIQTVVLSRELSLADIRALPDPSCRRLLPVYGRPRLMLLTHCPERTYRGLSRGRQDCTLCAAGKGVLGQCLRDRKECDYPLIPQSLEDGCRVGLYAPKPTSLASRWPELSALPVSPLLSFTTETPEERLSLIRQWRNLLDHREGPGLTEDYPDRLDSGVL